MKLIFFGASGAVPGPFDGNVSFAVTAAGTSALIDVSGTPIQSLLRAGIDPLSLQAVILTHAHPDHVYAFPSLIHGLWLLARRAPLCVAGPRTALEAARGLCAVFGLLERKGLFPIRWEEMGDGVVSPAGTMTIRLFPVDHSPDVATSGVRIEASGRRLVYSADTAPVPRVVEEARRAHTLIHEASGCAAAERELNARGHSSARQAGDAARLAGAARLYLCHFDRSSPPRPAALAREAREAFRGPVVVPRLLRPYGV